MKRHITLEQLSSLPEFARDNLWRYFEPKFKKELETISLYKQKKMGSIMMGKVIPLLDIPTMIEFLSKDFVVKMVQWGDEYKHWRVGLNWFGDNNYHYVVEQKELCDALWMACKYIVNE